MANPRLENGYTRIANEVMEALCSIRISGEARQCLDVIIRKTWGFNKKTDKIALSQFVLLTKMSKPSICRALNKLYSMNIIIIKKDNGDIIKKDNTKISSYGVNKDFSFWKALSKKITPSKALSKKIISVIKKDNP